MRHRHNINRGRRLHKKEKQIDYFFFLKNKSAAIATMATTATTDAITIMGVYGVVVVVVVEVVIICAFR